MNIVNEIFRALINARSYLSILFLALFLTACGGGGGSGGSTIDPSPNRTDTTAPSGYRVGFVSASIRVINLASAQLLVTGAEADASYSYEISDGVASVSGSGNVPSDSFNINVEDLSGLNDGTLTVRLQLTDQAGNEGQPVTATAEKDTTAPSGYSVSIEQNLIDDSNQSSLSFSVQDAEVGTSYSYQLSLGSSSLGGSGTVVSSSFDVSGIDVTSFPNGNINLSFSLEDSSDNEGAPVTDSVIKNASATTVIISGELTFDLVPHLQVGNGLDYDNINRVPIRGAVVEAVNSSNSVLSTTQSDANGNYALSVASSTDIRVQVKAQILQSTGARWDVKITDNTNSNALYVLAGSLVSSGAGDSTRDLHAGSGWGGSSYTGARSAGPFAILSAIYDTVQKFAAVDSSINFPELEIRWSVNNNTASGNLTEGDIGTSFYNGQAVYILGKENDDTDEYDDHIVIHEWGHYFEDKLSRADSIGGPHGPGDLLDMRVAFGEGFGNALSGIITDDSFYRDSFGNQQSSAFFINVENNNNTNAGWFSEGSVQSILYDLYDSEDDGVDTLSFGLKPMYDTLVDNSYTQNQFFTSIFSFMNQYQANLDNSAASSAQITDLLQAQDIFGTGDDGTGETNDAGGASSVLPVYTNMSVAGSPYVICSIDDFETVNKLGNRVFGQITFDASGSYTLEMTRTTGVADRDPDFIISSAGRVIRRAETENVDTESLTADFDAGTFALEAYDFKNVDTANGNNGDSCYEFSIQAN